MLNRSGESEYPCLLPDLRGNVFSFSPLTLMLAVHLSHMAFIMLKYVPSVPILVRVFIISRCWILSNVFSASIEMIMWLLCFILLLWFVTLIDLQTILVSLKMSSCIIVCNVFNELLNSVCYYFIENCCTMFTRDTGLQFSFLIVSLSGFGVTVVLNP